MSSPSMLFGSPSLMAGPMSPLQGDPAISTKFSFPSPTAFSSLFEETFQFAGGNSEHENIWLAITSQETAPNGPGLDFIRDGARLLLLMKQHSLFRDLIEALPNLSSGIIFKDILTSSLDSIIESQPDLSRDLSDLDYFPLADEIFQRSTKPPLPAVNVGPDGKLEVLIGAHPAWQLIGIILSAAGISLCRGKAEALPQQRDTLLKQLLHASDKCVEFQSKLASSGELDVWLLSQHLLLTISCHGLLSPFVWRSFNNLTTAIFAAGMHKQYHAVQADAPSYVEQLRRRLFAFAYSIDKQIAISLGRPAMMTSKFCHLQQPLDIADNDALRGLPLTPMFMWDQVSDNSSQQQDMHPATLARISMSICIFLHEIIDLDSNPRGNISSLSKEILNRLESTWKAIPSHLVYSSAEWSSQKDLDQCYAKLQNYILYLFARFLLQRRMAQTDASQIELLLDSCHEILTTLAKVGDEVSRLGKMNTDFSLIVALYGLPSAGFLAILLLQEIKSRLPLALNNTSRRIFRLKVTQELSMFVTCLERTISSNDGQFQVCQKAKGSIEAVLDRVLSPEICSGNSSKLDLEVLGFRNGGALIFGGK